MYEIKNLKYNTIYKRYYLYRPFSLLLTILLVNLISIKNARNLNNYISEIHLVIKGNGTQNILSNYFYIIPSEVIVNGISKGNTCKKTCDLDEDINNVTIKFDKKIESCYLMFNGLQNMIEIDLSNFDASKVNNMYWMFSHSKNLEKVNFGNINTSSVENMHGLFYFCEKLISIDLSNFDTSIVNDMGWMFAYCINLEKINFGNINTSSVKKMDALFYHCEILISIDLSNFDTCNVNDMGWMFGDCKNLKYLDLSNFNTSNVNNIETMFYDCQSLIYLNLNSFYLNNSVKMDLIFNFISPYVKICANDEIILNKLSKYSKSSDCSDICFKPNIKIDTKNKKCIESCLNNKYEYELNNNVIMNVQKIHLLYQMMN